MKNIYLSLLSVLLFSAGLTAQSVCDQAPIFVDPAAGGAAYAASDTVCTGENISLLVDFQNVSVAFDTIAVFAWFVNDVAVEVTGDRLDTTVMNAGPITFRVNALVVDTTGMRDTLCIASDTFKLVVIQLDTVDFDPLALADSLCRNNGPVLLPIPEATNGTSVAGNWTLAAGLVVTGTLNAPLSFDPANATRDSIVATFIPAPDEPCLAANSHTFYLKAVPSPGVPVSSFPTFCAGTIQSFDLNQLLIGENPGGIWQSGGVTTANPVAISTLSPGSYNYRYITEVAACADTSAVVTVMVVENPIILTASATNTTTCQTATGTITGTVNAQGRNFRINYTLVGFGNQPVVGNPIAAGTSNFSIGGLSAGTYRVSVEYLTTPSCAVTFPSNLIVADPNPPTVSIVASATAVCADGSISLSASDPGLDSYQWTLGGGTATNPLTSSDLGQVTWQGAAAGAKLVTLVAMRDGCTSATQQLTVNVQPLPAATVATPEGTLINCTIRDGGGLDLVGPATSGVSYQWSGPLTEGPPGQNPTFFATVAGQYGLTVTANTGLGCQASSSPVNLTSDLFDPNISVSAQNGVNTLTCTLASLNLTANVTSNGTGANSFTYQWNGGNNPDQRINTITSAGNYVVTVTNGRNGCTSTSIPLTISSDRDNPQVTDIIGLTTSDALILDCNQPGATLMADIANPQNFNYTWTGQGRQVFTANFSLGQSDIAGAYDLVVTDPSNQCTTPISFNLVKDFREPDLSIVRDGGAGNFNTCQGTAVNLRGDLGNLMSGDDPVYAWTLSGGGPTGSTATYTVPGTTSPAGSPYTVGLTVTYASNGCSATEQRQINVFGNPTVDDLVFNPQAGAAFPVNSLCLGGSGTLSGLVNNGTGNYQYRWEKDNVFLTGQPIAAVDALAVDDRVIYQLTVTDGNGCVGTRSEDIRIHPLPQIGISNAETSGRVANNFEVCTGDLISLSAFVTSNTTLPPYNYIWSTGSVSPTITPPVTQAGLGSYTVTVTDSRNCTETRSQEVNVRPNPDFTVSIDDGGNDILCSGESFELVASDPTLEYIWNNDPTGSRSNILSVDGFLVTGGPEVLDFTSSGTTAVFECDATVDGTFTINPNPEVVINDVDVRLELGFGGQFAADVQLGNNLTYRWTIRRPDGTLFAPPNSGPMSTTVNFNQTGLWMITLESTDANGCTSTVTEARRVDDGVNCSAAFRLTASLNSEYCPSEVYSITDQSRDGSTNSQRINNVAYTFVNADGSNEVLINDVSFPAGTYSVMAMAGDGGIDRLQFLNPGSWTVTMTVSNTNVAGGCNASESRLITVLPAPMLTAFDLQASRICQGDQATVVAQGAPGTRYRLTYENLLNSSINTFDFTGSGTNMTNAPSGSSFRAITLVNLDTGCSNELSGVVTGMLTVRARPVITDLSSTCASDNDSYFVSFTANTDGNVGYSVNGVPLTSGEMFRSPRISRDNPYSFTVEDAFGCRTIISGNPPSCECETIIGTWRDETVCQNERIQIRPPADYSSDGNDRLVYTLMEIAGPDSSVLFTSSPVTPTQNPNLIAVGSTYNSNNRYIIIIESANLTPLNTLDRNDQCLMRTEVEVNVLAEPTITFVNTTDIVACENTEVPIMINVTLPAGASRVDLRYLLSILDENNNPTDPRLVTGTITQNGSYTITTRVFNRTSVITLTQATTTFSDGSVCTTVGGAENQTRIVVNQKPVINNLLLICEEEVDEYRISFGVSTQNGSPFSVTGTPAGSISGRVFTSFPIPEENTYALTVTDGNGCTTVVDQLVPDCDTCQTMIGQGVWNNGELSFCESTSIRITDRPGGFFADSNDVIRYILRTRNEQNTIINLDTVTGPPNIPVVFGAINAYVSDLPRPTFADIVVFLGDDNGTGPENTGSACLASDTINLVITPIPTPVIEVLDPATNTFSAANGQVFARNTPDLQFRVRNGNREAGRYFWSIIGSGATYFDNPFSNPSYLSLNLGDTPGNYFITIRETSDDMGMCFGDGEIRYSIGQNSAGGEREVYLIDNNGINVLVVTGDDGCTYQWGSVAKNGNEDPIEAAGETFQSYTLGVGLDTVRRLYFVDVICGNSGATRYYYNRQASQVNVPRRMSPTGTANLRGLPGEVSIYPNPTAGAFQLRLQGLPPGAYTAELLDPLGRTAHRRAFSLTGSTVSLLDWVVPDNTPAGLYYLRVSHSSSGQVTTSLLIQR